MFKTFMLGVAAACLTVSAVSAHTIGIGWKDNGNGTVTLYAEHWHGPQTSAFSDNAGLGIFSSNGTFLYKTPWVSAINATDLNGDDTPTSVSVLTGYAPDANHAGYDSGTNDWFKSAPLVLGNGLWGFFTGSDCCVDTMSGIIFANVTGITSVDDGTGPVAAVSVPAGLPLLAGGLGLLGLVTRRRKTQA